VGVKGELPVGITNEMGITIKTSKGPAIRKNGFACLRDSTMMIQLREKENKK